VERRSRLPQWSGVSINLLAGLKVVTLAFAAARFLPRQKLSLFADWQQNGEAAFPLALGFF